MNVQPSGLAAHVTTNFASQLTSVIVNDRARSDAKNPSDAVYPTYDAASHLQETENGHDRACCHEVRAHRL